MISADESYDVQKIIIECIDESLNLLGPSVAEVVHSQIERTFGIKKEEIPEQPNAFFEALYSILGEGANVVKRLSVQKIREKMTRSPVFCDDSVLDRSRKNRASLKRKKRKRPEVARGI